MLLPIYQDNPLLRTNGQALWYRQYTAHTLASGIIIEITV